MSVTTFDTLKYSKRLRDAGVPEPQAEAQAEALAAAFDGNREELATKADLRELELRIGAQLLLLKWMTGIMLAGVLSLVMKAFFGS
jgi:hypothetical protein